MLLPEPVVPRKATVSPAGIVKLMFFKTGGLSSTYAKVTLSKVISKSCRKNLFVGVAPGQSPAYLSNAQNSGGRHHPGAGDTGLPIF